MKNFKNFVLLLIIIFSMAFLFGCGDSDSSFKGSSTIKGMASKGPITGATVSFFKVNENGTIGDKIGETVTENGSFEITLSYTGPVVAVAAGGTYIDEATGKTVALTENLKLRAALPNADGEINASITPLTELAVREAEKGGLRPEHIDEANKKISQIIFGSEVTDKDITQINPFDPSSDASGKSAEEKEYTLLLAAISQMSQTNGNEVSDIIDELSKDFEDNEAADTLNNIQKASETYKAKNKGSWVASATESMNKKLKDLEENSFSSAGDLQNAKKALIAFIDTFDDDKIPDGTTQEELADLREQKIKNFQNYMDNAPDIPEAHILRSIGIFLDLADDPYVLNIMKDLGVTDVFNLKQLKSLDFPEDVFKALIDSKATVQANQKGLFNSLENKLGLFQQELEEINLYQGRKFSLSLKGFGIISFDEIDIKVLKGASELLLAAIDIVQSHKFIVEDWGTEGDDPDFDDFAANPELFKHSASASAELESASQHLLEMKSVLTDANTKLYALTDEEQIARLDNAFALPNGYFKELVNFTVENTIGSLNDILTDGSTPIDIPQLDLRMKRAAALSPRFPYSPIEDSAKFVVIGDNAYETSKFKMYYTTLTPTTYAIENKITLSNFFNADISVQEISKIEDKDDFDWIGRKQVQKSAEYHYIFNSSGQKEVNSVFTNTDWTSPFTAIPLKNESIVIDGKDSDWNNASKIKVPGFDVDFKMAEDDGFIYYYVNVGDENILTEQGYAEFYILSRELMFDKTDNSMGGLLRMNFILAKDESGKLVIKTLDQYKNNYEDGDFEYNYIDGKKAVEIKISKNYRMPVNMDKDRITSQTDEKVWARISSNYHGDYNSEKKFSKSARVKFISAE